MAALKPDVSTFAAWKPTFLGAMAASFSVPVYLAVVAGAKPIGQLGLKASAQTCNAKTQVSGCAGSFVGQTVLVMGLTSAVSAYPPTKRGSGQP